VPVVEAEEAGVDRLGGATGQLLVDDRPGQGVEVVRLRGAGLERPDRLDDASEGGIDPDDVGDGGAEDVVGVGQREGVGGEGLRVGDRVPPREGSGSD
jgi:hypothetical protein